jgi:hypothetical protein
MVRRDFSNLPNLNYENQYKHTIPLKLPIYSLPTARLGVVSNARNIIFFCIR